MKPLQELRKLQSQHPWLTGLLISSTIVFQAPAAFADIIPSPAFAPTNVTQGGVSEFTLTLNNDALAAAGGLAFTKALPGGMRIAPTAPVVSNTCGGTVTAVPLSGTLRITGGSVPARVGSTAGQCKLTVKMIGISGGNQVLTFNPGDIAPGNTQAASATLQVAGLAKVRTQVSFGPTLIPMTGQSTMTINLFNDNGVALNGAKFASLLPAGLKITGSSLSNTCGGALTIDPPPTGFKLTGGVIPPGGCSFSWSIEGTLPGGQSQGDFTYSFADGILTTDEFVSNDAGGGTLKVQQGLRVEQALSRGSAVGGSAAEGGTLEIYTGETAKLTLKLSNAGGAISNVNLAQALPAGLTIADNVTSTTCTGMNVTATAGAATFNFAGGGMPAATATTLSECEVTVNVTAAGAGSYTNNITLNTINNTQNSRNLNASAITLNIVPITAGGGNGIGVGVDFQGGMNTAFYAANQVSAGNEARMNIYVYNGAGIPLSGVGFGAGGVQLPAGVVLAATPNPTTNCVGGAVGVGGTNTINLSGASLDRRETCVVSVSVVSNTAATYVENIAAGGFVSAEGRSNSAGAGTLQVLDYINMEQYFEPTVVAASATGNKAKMKLRLTNAALAASANTKLNFNLAGGLKLIGGFLSNSCNGTLNLVAGSDVFDLTGATIPAATGQGLGDDGFCDIEYEVLAAGPAGQITNTIPPNSLTNGAGQSNATGTSAILNLADVQVAINQGVLNVTPGDANFNTPIVTGGEPARLSVTLTNQSNIGLTNVGYETTFPAGAVIYADPAPNNGDCTGITITALPNDNKYKISGVQLNPYQACTFSVQMTNLVPGNTQNVIPVKAVTSLQGGTNSQPSEVTLTTLANATVSKTFTPATIAAGGTSKLTLNLVNANNIALTNVGLPDIFPDGMVVANTPNLTNTCGGTVNAAPGDARAALVGGTLARNSICTITVDVTALTAQPYTNTIPVGAMTSTEEYTNSRQIDALLNVTGTTIVRPGLRLVKRITDIDGTPITGLFNFTPATGRDDDNAPKWPGPVDAASGISPYLKGAYQGSQVLPQQNALKVGSTIEYTGYFLSDGNGVARNAALCDLLPANTEIVPGSASAQLGDGTAVAVQVIAPGAAVPASCKATPSNPTGQNVSGAIVVPLNNLANATGAGAPATSYGNFKFKLKLK